MSTRHGFSLENPALKGPSPAGMGRCPVCHGTGVGEALTAQEQKYHGNQGITHNDCQNCGGQTMGRTPAGFVRLNKAGEPCKHTYKGRSAGRCYTIYTCTDCGGAYNIDSGD
jgi:rRNA maturation protein Nop10